jgi:hypothetical protein
MIPEGGAGLEAAGPSWEAERHDSHDTSILQAPGEGFGAAVM